MILSEIDKTELIYESYRIDGIDISQCRVIFLDWAIKLPDRVDVKAAIEFLLETYARDAPGHPMTLVLRDGLVTPARTGRRGGNRSRHSGA